MPRVFTLLQDPKMQDCKTDLANLTTFIVGKSTGNIKRDYESQFGSEFLNLTYLSPSCNCSLFVYTNVHNKSLDMMSPYLLLHNVMRGCFLLFPKLVKNSYKI